MKKLFQKIASAVSPRRSKAASKVVELDPPDLAIVAGGDESVIAVPRRRRGPTMI